MALRPLEGSKGYFSTISIHRNNKPYVHFCEWIQEKQKDRDQRWL